MRKSKREIKQALEEIEEGPPSSEYPVVDTLSEFLAYELEAIDEGEYLYEGSDGTVYYVNPGFLHAVDSALSDE